MNDKCPIKLIIIKYSPEWFKSKADKVILQGNSLINLHRAHRLDAIEKEIINHPEIEMIFCGFMGGDYIKGIVYDDYITARLVRLWEFNKNKRKTIIIYLIGPLYHGSCSSISSTLSSGINCFNLIIFINISITLASRGYNARYKYTLFRHDRIS